MNLAGVCPLTTEDALARAVALAPDVPAVVTPRERVGYAELARRVAAIRSALAASGVRRGDHVAICLGNGPTWVALFLAVGSLGAVVVPVNTRFTAGELAYTLRESRASTLFVADRVHNVDFRALLREIHPAPDLRTVVFLGPDPPAGAVPWDEFTSRAAEPVGPLCTPDDTLLIQYTSGTTARPKGVLLTHRNICANGFFSGARTGLRVADRMFSPRPFFHVAGTTLSITACLQHAATLVTMERFEPGAALELMAELSCTHFAGNETIALMLLNHPDRARHRLTLRGAWAAASPAIVRRIIDELGASECVVGYGLSEASPNVAQSAWWEDEAIRVAGRMRPQPGVEVEIRDPDTGRTLPSGHSGEILVRGWNVMRGYFHSPEETAAALSADGWLSTGDIGRLDEMGRLEFLGRRKDLIKVGGENVAPVEIEDVLHRHPDIQQAAVVGVADPRLIEVPFAFVVLAAGSTLRPEDVIAWTRRHLAGFKVPRHVRIVDGFEVIGMTASAKVPKRHLAAFAEKLLNPEPGPHR